MNNGTTTIQLQSELPSELQVYFNMIFCFQQKKQSKNEIMNNEITV